MNNPNEDTVWENLRSNILKASPNKLAILKRNRDWIDEMMRRSMTFW